MEDFALNTLLVLFSSGFGLMLFGGANFLLSQRSAAVRYSVGASAAAICPLLMLALGEIETALSALALLACGLAMFFLGTSNLADRALGGLLAVSKRVGVQSAVLAAVGGALMAGSLAYFSQVEDARLQDDQNFLDEMWSQPPLDLSEAALASTDLEEAIPLRTASSPRGRDTIDGVERKVLSSMGYDGRAIRTGPASDLSNCHGWVFTGGRYWIGPDEVQVILEQNGYARVSDPRLGDVVIYRQMGTITHSGIVRSIGVNQELFVESKWGWMGVFIHPIDGSPYGKEREIYRTSRGSHIISGLKPAAAAAK